MATLACSVLLLLGVVALATNRPDMAGACALLGLFVVAWTVGRAVVYVLARPRDTTGASPPRQDD